MCMYMCVCSSNLLGKIIVCAEAPMQLMRKLTVPLQDEEMYNRFYR
jgi:hypothetical protein